MTIGTITELYGGRYSPGSFYELVSLALAARSSAFHAFVATIIWAGDRGVPRSVVPIAAPIFVVVSVITRLLQSLRTRYIRRVEYQKKAVVSVQARCWNYYPQLLIEFSRKYRPVALLDDDPDKSRRWNSVVKMRGTLNELPRVARSLGAEVVTVAIPKVDAAFLKKIRTIAIPFGFQALVLPSCSEICESHGLVLLLQELEIEDLMGRRAISVDSRTPQSYLEGRIVVVSGAGGSIGIGLCKQVLRYRPKRLLFLDRDETSLQLAQLATKGSGLCNTSDIILADTRDGGSLSSIFLRQCQIWCFKPPRSSIFLFRKGFREKRGKPTL